MRPWHEWKNYPPSKWQNSATTKRLQQIDAQFSRIAMNPQVFLESRNAVSREAHTNNSRGSNKNSARITVRSKVANAPIKLVRSFTFRGLLFHAYESEGRAGNERNEMKFSRNIRFQRFQRFVATAHCAGNNNGVPRGNKIPCSTRVNCLMDNKC